MTVGLRSPSSTSSPTRSRTSTSTSSGSIDDELTTAARPPRFRALAEGDALRDRGRLHRPRRSPTTEQAAYDEEYAGELADERGGHQRRARLRQRHASARPTLLGQPFVAMLLANQGGNDARRRGLRAPARPPRSTSSTRPATSPTREPRTTRPRPRTTTSSVFDDGPFGSPSLVPRPRRADRPQGRLRGRPRAGTATATPRSSATSRTCVRAAFAGDTERGRGRDGRRPRRSGWRPCPAARRKRDRGRRATLASRPATRDRTSTCELTGPLRPTSLYCPACGATSSPTPPPASRPTARAASPAEVLDGLTYERDHRPRGRRLPATDGFQRTLDARPSRPVASAIVRRRRSSRGRATGRSAAGSPR